MIIYCDALTAVVHATWTDSISSKNAYLDTVIEPVNKKACAENCTGLTQQENVSYVTVNCVFY